MTPSTLIVVLTTISGCWCRSPSDREIIMPRGNHSEPNLYINPQIQVATLINSVQELALDISGSQWDQGNSGNVVLSPISISSLLSLILLGARGDSHSELKRALRFPNNLPDAIIHETYQTILGALSRFTPGVNITMTSRLFLQEGFPILGTYTQIAQALYNSNVNGLDFAKDPVGATKQVNKFVEDNTHGFIRNLISQPFSRDTKFVAVNAIYFKGAWKFPFSEPSTRLGTFDNGVRNISIPMMSNLLHVPYLKGEQIGLDIISLPYEGDQFEMIIIKPRGKVGTKSLMRVEYSLDSTSINQLISMMKPTKIAVTIPRMKLRQKLYLKKDLQNLGANSIFDPQLADLGRISTTTDIFLNEVVHEAVIEINEEGTVAAGATAGTVDRIGGFEHFQLNRPSLILIRDVSKGLTLFYSRVNEPEPIFGNESSNNRKRRRTRRI